MKIHPPGIGSRSAVYSYLLFISPLAKLIKNRIFAKLIGPGGLGDFIAVEDLDILDGVEAEDTFLNLYGA